MSTECQPGTIRTIPLPVGTPHLGPGGYLRSPASNVRVLAHGDHLDVFEPASEDETDTTTEAARVLLLHASFKASPEIQEVDTPWWWECDGCATRLAEGGTGRETVFAGLAAHQAAMLAEAGLLRDYAVNAHESCNRELGNALGMAEKAQQWPFKPGAVLHWPEDPQTVVDALEAAPQGTLVSDADGCEFVRYEGEWCHGEAWRMTSVRLAQRGPLTVISVGEGS